MGPAIKNISYINSTGRTDQQIPFRSLNEFLAYTARLASEYPESLIVEKAWVDNPSLTAGNRDLPLDEHGKPLSNQRMVDALNQPIWYEPSWSPLMYPGSPGKRSNREENELKTSKVKPFKTLNSSRPVTIAFKRPEWADNYDPPYPTEAMVIYRIIVYAMLPPMDNLNRIAIPNDAIDMDHIFRASGSYGVNYIRFLRNVPVDSGVKARNFVPTAQRTGQETYLWLQLAMTTWGWPLMRLANNGDVVPIEQPEGRLTVKLLLPKRTIAVRAYAMPSYRITPDLIPYQDWIYPGDTNEPVSPDNTFDEFPWLVDPNKYSPSQDLPTDPTEPPEEA